MQSIAAVAPLVAAPMPAKKTTPAACAVKFKKTEMCRYYPKCAKGQDCMYAHSEAELRVRPNFTKTRMCTGYRHGRCKLLASECAFAHGREDLRPSGEPAPTGKPRTQADPDLAGCQAVGAAFQVSPPPGLALPSAHAGGAATPTASGASTPTFSAKLSWRSGSCTPPGELQQPPPTIGDFASAWLRDTNAEIARGPEELGAETLTVVARLRL
mmetsp:Transcript_58607/g.169630  ORF Transcript_58607/g.169630 Transcript_58607/m.169630 type:complete len:213 (-) Transcript_58607:777-1415(-)